MPLSPLPTIVMTYLGSGGIVFVEHPVLPLLASPANMLPET
jgi:hypothetical protein